MDNNKNKRLTDTIIDNDDYYFRDFEMFRADLNEPKHEIDPTYDIDKSVLPNKRVKIKKEGME